jgi:hypothetical protein
MDGSSEGCKGVATSYNAYLELETKQTNWPVMMEVTPTEEHTLAGEVKK